MCEHRVTATPHVDTVRCWRLFAQKYRDVKASSCRLPLQPLLHDSDARRTAIGNYRGVGSQQRSRLMLCYLAALQAYRENAAYWYTTNTELYILYVV